MKKHTMPVLRHYMNKEDCLAEAERILREGIIDGMKREELAEEIYFHAVIHDVCMKTGLFTRTRAHADPIDLNDGGDTPFRRLCFHMVWKLKR